jgi:DNA-binding transcriptional LysR family regulator
VLTETGGTYLERVRQILTEVDEAEAFATAATSEPRGHLRVLAPPAFAVHQIAKHLPKFRAQYPLVSIELVVRGPVETVDENFDISIVIVTSGTLNGDFVARRLARSEIIACASPEYLDRRGRPTHPSELPKHESMTPTFLREIAFHRYVRGQPAPVESVSLATARSGLSTTHIDTLYASALAGLGIAGLPSFVAEDALMEHALERVVPDWQIATQTIYAAMPTRKHVPARTRAFIDFLVTTFGGTDHDPWLAAAGCASPGAL